MRIVLFCHSLLSDWNHGNAHFLRGVVGELTRRGHTVDVYEPAGSWSFVNLLADGGTAAVAQFHARYPGLGSRTYRLDELRLDEMLADAELVIVHEWSDPELVRRVGAHRARHDYVLLFHDTHHRLLTKPEEMHAYDLSHYDGVLAFGEVLRELYVSRGLCRRAFTWHEAADPYVFAPMSGEATEDLVWIGNWGDDERTRELDEFLLEPARRLGLSTNVHGVRYPREALEALRGAGVCYRGWLANFRVPEVFARHRMTVHVPRRPYVQALVGVPTIRVFEALACGIPLVCAPWEDAEHLFTPGDDYLVARDGAHMIELLRTLAHEPALRARLRERGLATIRARHTCAHRVDELLRIRRSLRQECAPSSVLESRGGEPCPLQ
jgi:spore maturation protein CgeB